MNFSLAPISILGRWQLEVLELARIDDALALCHCARSLVHVGRVERHDHVGVDRILADVLLRRGVLQALDDVDRNRLNLNTANAES